MRMWLDKLSLNIKQEIHNRDLSIDQLAAMKDWPTGLVELIFSFKFGNNKVLQLIQLLNDISLRDDKPIGEPLKSSEWLDIYNNPKIPIFQKGLWLRQFLLAKRYPAYTEFKEKIKRIINKFNLPKNISIDNELLSLEKNTVTFKIECKQTEDLKNAAQKLMEIADSCELKKLLDLLKM